MTKELACNKQMKKPALQECLPSLLLLTLALALTSIMGSRTILLLKKSFFFRYFQMIPSVMLLLASGFFYGLRIEDIKRAFQTDIFKASLCLVLLAPFITWTIRTASINCYFEICNIAAIAAFFWWKLSLMQLFKSIASDELNSFLLIYIKKAEFFILWFEIVPVSALYFSGILAVFTGILPYFNKVFSIWTTFGGSSLFIRILLYCGLLQCLALCLYFIWLANRKITEKFSVEFSG